jgi:hypothetical protein
MPPEHWRCLRANNPLEGLMREIRRRTRVVGAFPDGQPALMLVAARLGMLPQPSEVRSAICRWPGWPKSWPSPERFAPGPHGNQEQNHPTPTTFLSKTEERKCEKLWTLPTTFMGGPPADEDLSPGTPVRARSWRWTNY